MNQTEAWRAKPRRVVIFDFDGTIADTMPFLVDLAARLLVARYGLGDTEARKAYVDTTGLPFCRQMEIIFPGNPLNAATIEEFEAEKRNHLADFKFFADAKPVVAELRKHGIKVCLSSGNVEGIIEPVLVSRGLVVDLVMGWRPGFEKGPDHFRFAATTFGVALGEMLFVGDSLKDGLAAKTTGVNFIARAGLVDLEELERQLPGTPAVNSLVEILPYLGINKAREGLGLPNSSRAS
ncbi:MAG TPA: HAD hydrolase-like protein [bacterium]|nr:HAD hydrolase-like protein [bacterium]